MQFRTWVRAGTVALTAGGFAMTASAGVVILGNSGWQASWDDALGSRVDINVDAVTGQAVLIEKAAEFTSFAPIDITFTQIAANAVGQIIINDEILTNSTGSPWTDFHMALSGNDSAVFNAAATNASGFSIAPFTNLAFAPNGKSLDLTGGVVPNGGVYFPGATQGELYINVTPNTFQPFASFTLREFPTPEPTTLSLLAIGAAAFFRRR